MHDINSDRIYYYRYASMVPGQTVFYVVALRSWLGLRCRIRGHRAGLHCVRSRRSYVLTSSVPGSIPVITGNRPLRVCVFDPEAASVPPSSAASSRIPVGVDHRPTDCLIRPDLKRHAFHPTRQLMCAMLNIHFIANKVDVVSQCWRDHELDVLRLTETWHEDADDVALRRLRSTGLQMLEWARPVRPGVKTDDIFYQNYGGVAVVTSSAVRLSKISAPFEPITLSISSPRRTSCGVRPVGRIRINHEFTGCTSKLKSND